MRGSLLLILLVALGVLFVLRVRRRLALLAEQIRQLRANALEPIAYTPATDRSLDEPLAKITAEATGLGFLVLGDHVEHSGLTRDGRAQRWIVDAAGTTFGWVAPFDADGQRHILVALMSHELDQQTITSRQPPASLLSRPPFVDMQTLPIATSLTEMLAKHGKRAQLDDSDRGFIPVRTFEQLEAELDRMRSKVAAWRRAQPADALLEADLKSLLGAQYGKLAGPLRRRLV